MLTAKDLMHTDLVALGPDDSVAEAIALLLDRGLSGLPVVDGSCRLLGYLSEFDLLSVAWDPTELGRQVCHHMARQIHRLEPGTPLATLVERFRTLAVRELPVVSDGQLLGVVRRSDVLRCAADAARPLPPPMHIAPAVADAPPAHPARAGI